MSDSKPTAETQETKAPEKVDPFKPVTCQAVDMPGRKKGDEIVLSARDAEEYAALGKVKIT